MLLLHHAWFNCWQFLFHENGNLQVPSPLQINYLWKVSQRLISIRRVQVYQAVDFFHCKVECFLWDWWLDHLAIFGTPNSQINWSLELVPKWCWKKLAWIKLFLLLLSPASSLEVRTIQHIPKYIYKNVGTKRKTLFVLRPVCLNRAHYI